MRRSACLLFAAAALAVLTTASAAVVGASPGGTEPRALDGDERRDPRLSAPENTTIRARLYANTSARWSITTTYALDGESERRAFERYARTYRRGETDAGVTNATFVGIAASASGATGRQMAITNVTRSGRVGTETGSVTLSLLWTNMLARGENETLRFDDAVLLAGNRTWLRSLSAEQTLVVRTPPGYSIVDSGGLSFDIRNNALAVEGPRRFGRPFSVTYRRTGGEPPPEEAIPWDIVIGGLVVVAVVTGLAAVRGRKRDRTPEATADGNGRTPEPEGEGEGRGVADQAAKDGETPDDGVDPELLSDEERVERLLEANGGRMKQATIVAETGWSDAKVSQLLSAMADEGRVEKLRLGRENLISLPNEAED